MRRIYPANGSDKMTVQAAILVLTTAFAPLASAPVAAQTGAVLTVSSGVTRTGGIEMPGDMPMMLLRRSFADLLKQGGLTLDGWMNACRVNAPICAQGMQGVSSAVAAVALMQGTDARFDPVQAGTYYVFALGKSAADPVVWDVRVDLHAGANAVRLDERNHLAAGGGGGGGAAIAAAAPAPTQTPAGPAGDPSIAKARAAKVDTRVFGIPLGEPLRLPSCDTLGGLFTAGPVQPIPTCVIDTSGGNLLAAFVGLDLVDKDVATIQLSSESCPTWMSTCAVNAALRDGNLVRVELTTKGRGVEQATGNELRGKYGAPTASTRGTVTPDVGNPFTVTDLVWSFPGLRVEFQPVTRVDGDDSRVKTNEGLVRIETDTSYQLRQKEVKEQSKPKL